MRYSTAIGIDTHGKSNTIYAIDTKTGAFTETALSANPEEAIRWIVKQGFDGPVMAVYESGPTGFGLARALIAADIPCQVAAVSKLPERRDKKKNDREDAKHLAKQLIADEVHPVWIPSPKQEALRNLSRLRGEVAASVRSAKQRVNSFLLLMGIAYTDGKRWTGKFKAWAKKLEFSQETDTYVFREKLSETYRLAARLADIEERLKATVAADPALCGLAARLKCVHGIGDVTAFSLICEAGDINRFKNGSAFASFLGLVPSEDSTGERQKRGKITKQGNSHLRRLLVEAAGCYSRRSRLEPPQDASVDPLVRQHAHKCSKRLKKRRDALAERGKSANKAKVAVAREMAEWIYHIATM
jgi:transposase